MTLKSMVLEIAQLGQPVLRQPAAQVSPERIATMEFQHFLKEMVETLRHEQGAGLAAPQVFVSERVFLAAILPSLPPEEAPGIEVFINPKLTPLSDERIVAWEGCLSFPELLVRVPRYRVLRIDYLDAQGDAQTRELRDFPARVVQHEFDHLEGILTLERALSTRDIIKASEIDALEEDGMTSRDDES